MVRQDKTRQVENKRTLSHENYCKITKTYSLRSAYKNNGQGEITIASFIVSGVGKIISCFCFSSECVHNRTTCQSEWMGQDAKVERKE